MDPGAVGADLEQEPGLGERSVLPQVAVGQHADPLGVEAVERSELGDAVDHVADFSQLHRSRHRVYH
jgi:hypothetical protein